MLTFSTLLLVLALGFVFGRVVVARAFVQGSAELKRTGTQATPGGQALSSSALAGSAGARGEDQPAAPEQTEGGAANGGLPREEIRPEAEETREGTADVAPRSEEDSLPPAAEAGYTVQIDAFRSEENARAAAIQLTRAGYPARIEVDRQQHTYRVTTGSYETEESAEQALRDIQGEGFPRAFVTPR
jgi:cell division protein FtsN